MHVGTSILLLVPVLGAPLVFARVAWPETGSDTAPKSQALSAVSPRPKFKSPMHVPVKLAGTVTPLPPSGYKLVWSDEFNGDRLNLSEWVHRTDSKHLSTQLPANVSVRDGKLYLALKKETAMGMEYTGSGVVSKRDFMYGYYEARFKTPPAESWHTSFWAMLHDGSGATGVAESVLELDFCEQDGGDPHLYSFGVINHHPDPAKGQSGNAGRWVIEDAPDTSAGFHVWAGEFTPEKVRFYFDGRLTKEIGAGHFPHEPMHVWLTSIASKLKGDRFVDESMLPTEAVFDYVRIYRNPQYDAAEKNVRASVAQRKASRERSPKQ